MTIHSRAVPTAWTMDEGGKVHLPLETSRRFETQLQVLADMMRQDGRMPDYSDRGEFRQYHLEYGHVMAQVIEAGFDVLLDEAREYHEALAERALMKEVCGE